MASKSRKWRMAKALDRLLAEVNAFAPKRSKLSDGGIGDAVHASRSSDHNPWHIVDGIGVVTARDFTHDPSGGLDCNVLADRLIRSADPRIKYIIWNKRIVSGTGQKQAAWKWRKYTGANGHTKHLHISVKPGNCDDVSGWMLIATKPDAPANGMLKKGDTGKYVQDLQRNLSALGYSIQVTGTFDERTEAVVEAFQKVNGLLVDGKAGIRTNTAIGHAIAAKVLEPKIDEAKKNIPPTADKAVKEETNWFNKVIGWFTGGGLLTAFGLGNWSDADWTTILAMAGGVVLVGGAAVGGFLLLGNRVAAKFDEINARAKG
jgi:hypothetical protein